MRLAPSVNKFHSGSAEDGKHYWLTPGNLFAALTERFKFTFDPCPYPKPEDFDGLTCEWGSSNYVNPPFGSIMHEGKRKGMTAWVRKAITEFRKGKTVVLVYPIDKWVLMLLAEGAKVSNLGDVRWLSIEDGAPGKGTGRHIACFVLDATKKPKCWCDNPEPHLRCSLLWQFGARNGVSADCEYCFQPVVGEYTAHTSCEALHETH